MKFKKSTYVTFLVSTVLVCGTGLVFATENKEINEVESFGLTKNEQSDKIGFSISSKSTDLYSPKVESDILVSKAKSDGETHFSTAKVSVIEFREHEESSMSKVTNSENSEETYVNKSSNSKDVLYTDSGEVSIEQSGYNDNRFVISRKGNLLAVNKEQYRTWIE